MPIERNLVIEAIRSRIAEFIKNLRIGARKAEGDPPQRLLRLYILLQELLAKETAEARKPTFYVCPVCYTKNSLNARRCEKKGCERIFEPHGI